MAPYLNLYSFRYCQLASSLLHCTEPAVAAVRCVLYAFCLCVYKKKKFCFAVSVRDINAYSVISPNRLSYWVQWSFDMVLEPS